MKSSQVLRNFRKEKSEENAQTLRLVRVSSMSERTVELSSKSSGESHTLSSEVNGSSGFCNQLTESPVVCTSKLCYVNPLTREEIEERKNRMEANGNIGDASPSMKRKEEDPILNGSLASKEVDSGNLNGFYAENGKRSRIVSDEEGEEEQAQDNPSNILSKRLCVEDDDEEQDSTGSWPSSSHENEKFSPEMIEKLLDTYDDMYPHIDKMEIFETMKEYDYNFSEMTRKLDQRSKEERSKLKKKDTDVSAEERKYKMIEKRELIKAKKRADAAKKKMAWKLKARSNDMDEIDEDGDEYIGKNNVYDSDSSDEENTVDNSTVSPARKMVLDFFNESSVSELSCLPTCSKKKAEVLISRRPFDSWDDLVYKIKVERSISTDLLNFAKDMLQMRNAIKNLMRKCERISSEIQKTVTEMINEADSSSMIRQPGALIPEMQLKHYQLIGLNWLVLMHEQNLNGVLADEMGLGKTIQAISFLAHLMEIGELENNYSLIVVPSSTLDNWARELRTWCPSLKFFTYHGSQEERRGMRLAFINNELEEDVYVILTTYSMISNNSEDRALFKRLPVHTIVYDEAHMLKNMTTQRYENLMKIKCSRRVLLTGTPLQNNLVELMSILVFVMPQLFEGRKDELKKVFSMFPKGDSEQDKSSYEKERIGQAKRIMGPFFLRRLKEDVLKDLPLKSDEVLHIPMNERQSQLYKDTVKVLSQRAEQIKVELEKSKLKDLEEVDELLVSNSKSPQKGQCVEDSSSNMLMRLRKTANHPLLVRNLYNDVKIKEMAKILKKTTHRDSIVQYMVEDFSVMSDFEIHQYCAPIKAISHYKLSDDQITSSGKMEKLDDMLPKMKENGDRVLLFSQFVIVLDVIQAYMKIRGYSYRRLDGSTAVTERQEMIDEFNEDESIFVFLLSTRAGGLGINLSSANTVILHDIDFNPYNDKQAEDRCHRVGQTRPVKVYRFLSAHSIEEGVYQIAQNKLKLEKDVTGKTSEDQSKADVVTLLKTALQEEN